MHETQKDAFILLNIFKLVITQGLIKNTKIYFFKNRYYVV
jgi:hypothetical protein